MNSVTGFSEAALIKSEYHQCILTYCARTYFYQISLTFKGEHWLLIIICDVYQMYHLMLLSSINWCYVQHQMYHLVLSSNIKCIL